MTHQCNHSDDTHSCGCANHDSCGGCGGGGCSSGGCGHQTFTQEERTFLLDLLERHFLPMAQFVVKSSQNHDFEMVALSPVYLTDPKATMAEIRTTGDMLCALEDQGLLTLDFDIPLDPMSYEIYEKSDVFALLCDTVEQSKGHSNHWGDTPTIEQGSIAITAECLKKFG